MPNRILPTLIFLLGAAPAAAQGTGVTLGRGSFNGLRARVVAIRFFESGGGVPAPKERVVTTKFDALTTRFIYLELELDYAKAAKRTAFEIECRFEGPGPPRALTLAGTVEPGWIGSYHAGGTGSAERGEWTEGKYEVSCRDAGKVVVSAQVEVVKSTAAVRKLGAAVIQMKFFQSLAERLPVETRRYSTRFDSRARWIKTEFALVYPQAPSPVTFLVECAYVFPDKSVKRVTNERQIPAGWTGSVHAQGISGDDSGKWPVGKYTVSCWNNGEKMAERSFEVFEGSAMRGPGPGELRFHAGKGARDTAFEVGKFDTLFVDAAVPVRAAGDSTTFGCILTDPAGITSAFTLMGSADERSLNARGPVATPEGPLLRGVYRVECRTGARAVLVDRFVVTGKSELAQLDARLVSKALYAGGDEPPGDEAVPDVVFSAGKLKSVWVVAVLDHPSGQAPAMLEYSCRITGPRNTVLANSGPQTLPVANADRAIVLTQRLDLLPRQRWTPGKYAVECESGTRSILREAIDLTR